MDRRQFLLRSLSTFSVAAVSILAACTATQENAVPSTTGDPAAAPTTTPTKDRRVLLAYFSRPGENHYYGDRVTLETATPKSSPR